MDYRVYFLYKAKNTTPLVQPIHQHICYELVFYTEGSGNVIIDGIAHSFKTGDIIVVPKDTPHATYDDVPHASVVLGFFYTGSEPLKTGKFTPPMVAKDLIETMLAEIESRESQYLKVLALQTEILMLYLARSVEKPANKEFSGIVANIEAFINENLTQKISLNDFARAYHYSPSRFRHLFTEQVGTSPKQFIIKKRLKRAKEILAETKKTLTEIAQECGFYDSAQFSRIFKSHIGESPSEYRKRKKLAAPKKDPQSDSAPN